MNLIPILGMSKEIKWKVKVVLVEVSLMNFHSWDIQGDQMEGQGGVIRSIFVELHCWDIQRDQREGEKWFY